MPTSSECPHERSHILDSSFHGDSYGSEVGRRIFCDVCRLQRWLDVEVALADAQAELGIIPLPAAGEIRRAADVRLLDLSEVKRGISRTGHSLVPLLRAVQAVCRDRAGEFLHYGATTQDIQDTAQSLEVRDVLDAVDASLVRLLDHLVTLAEEHRLSTCVARTHSMPALPTTFGLKVAGWADELHRHLLRLRTMRNRILVVQLFGGAGTMAAMNVQPWALLDGFARRLGLSVPNTGWHVARDRIAEFVSSLAMVAASTARIADELRTLNRPELQEVTLSWDEQQISSSTMPHKRNPETCEQIVVLARLARAQVGIALDAMVVEHERDYRGIRLEWSAIAEVSHYTLACLKMMLDVFTSGVRINRAQMLAAAQAHRHALCSERVMFVLAEHMGKESAFRLLHRISHASQDLGRNFDAALEEDDELLTALGGRENLRRLFDPETYAGASEQLVQRVIDDIRRTVAPGAQPTAQRPANKGSSGPDAVLPAAAAFAVKRPTLPAEKDSPR
jgi:adenylosuccinate lyase